MTLSKSIRRQAFLRSQAIGLLAGELRNHAWVILELCFYLLRAEIKHFMMFAYCHGHMPAVLVRWVFRVLRLRTL
jgi:hypothetical protein